MNDNPEELPAEATEEVAETEPQTLEPMEYSDFCIVPRKIQVTPKEGGPPVRMTVPTAEIETSTPPKAGDTIHLKGRVTYVGVVAECAEDNGVHVVEFVSGLNPA